MYSRACSKMVAGFSALTLLAGCTSEPTIEKVERPGAAPAYQVSSEDEEMLAAYAKARSTLPQFIKTLKTPAQGQHSFAIKRAFAGPENVVEHLWITDVTFDGNHFRGTLSNTPSAATGLAIGDEIEVLPEDISDWMYLDNGRLVGGYSMKILKERGSLPLSDFAMDQDAQRENAQEETGKEESNE